MLDRLSRRRLLGLGVAATAVGAGCRSGTGSALRFWAMGSEGEVMPALLQGFAREYPAIKVKLEQLPWSSAHEKLLTAFAGDATPDLAQMGNSWLPEMAALGALEPLQPFLAEGPALRQSDYFPGIWQTNEVMGQLLGMPWYVDTRLMFVRHDLLARAGVTSMPQSWPAWLDSMAALQASGVKTPVYLPLDEFAPLLALALQQPDELLKDGGRRGNFASPGFRRALGFYAELFRRGYAPGLSTNTVANVWQEIGRGSFAYYISGPWNIGEFKKRLAPELQSSWSTAPLPGPTGPGASVAGGASLVIFKKSALKREAWALIEYLSRPAVQLEFYRLTGNLPPRRSSWAMPLKNGAHLASDPHARAFADQLERVRPAPMVPEGERIVQEMQLFAARAVHEQGRSEASQRAALDASVAALDVRVDGILEKRRWMLDRQAQRAGEGVR